MALLAVAVVVAGCAAEPEPEPASAPCPKPVTAPEAVTTPDSAPDDDTDGTLLDAEAYANLLDATDSFLAGLADAGGGTFADYDVWNDLGSILLNPVFEASGLAAIGPNGEEFPAGVDLATLTAEERADWARAGQQVVELFRRELDTWPRIDAALDTSRYGYDILDELSDRIRAHMLLDVTYFEAMLALAECHGTEALAGTEAMTLTAAWLGDERRGTSADQIIRSIDGIATQGPFEFDPNELLRDLAGKLNMAVSKIGMGVGE